jgi:hypothetical protein
MSTTRGLGPAWLAGLGLVACGPLAPATTDDPETSSTTDGPTTTTTGTTTTVDPTTTGVPNTGPDVECRENLDCGFCKVCEQNVCIEDWGCCDYYVTPDGAGGWRCQPPPERCFDDFDCPEGYVCEEDGVCFPEPPPPEPQVLPACDAPPTMLSEWNLSAVPSAFDLADLDGDGDLDLYAALPSGAAIELAFNDGAGNFTGGTLVDVGAPLPALHPTAADLDGDGDIDLAVARPNSGDLIVLFGQDGKFEPGPVLSASSAPWTVTAADVDLDGNTDLVTIGNFLAVSVWFGVGAGQFDVEKFAPDVVDSQDATVVDVDLDGVPDILSPPSGATILKILRGDQSGAWTLAREFDVGGAGWSPAHAADLGGTPGVELAIVRDEGPNGLALVWESLGPSEWSQSPGAYVTTARLTGGRFADVTGDGLADLVSATSTAKVAALVGDGAGGFACELVVETPADTSRALLATGDVDGDGRTDIVAGVADGSAVSVIFM